MVENESLFVTCQTAKALTRVIHTVVIHRFVGINLKINEPHCSDMKTKRSPYDNRVALAYFNISLGNTKGYRSPYQQRSPESQ